MATQYTAGLNVGDVLTAATMNSIGAAWEPFTPTVTQGVNVTFTNTYSKYTRINKLVIYSFSLALTSAGTGGNGLTLTIPITAAASQRNQGIAQFYDASATTSYINVTYAVSTTVIGFINSASGAGAFGGTPNVAVANGDFMFGTIIYEAA